MEMELYYLPVVVACFFMSMFFSISETALTSITPIEAEKLASEGGFFKSSMRRWAQQSNRILTTILVGNTAANTFAASFATQWSESVFPEYSITVVTLASTAVLLFVSEIAPKTVARAHPHAIAPVACRILIVIDWILYPITYFFIGMVSVVMRVLGITLRDRRLVTHADIEYMVSIAGRQGTIENDKSKILSSIFQFSKRRVKDIMIPREKISAISVDAKLMDVLDIVRVENHSRYPVYNQSLDRIVGFFHARDLFAILRSYGIGVETSANTTHFSLRTMLRRAFYVSEHSMISRVLNEMKSNRIHLAIVKDEWGNVVGLVTLEDILEQVFGEIEDEHDEQASKPVVDLYSAGIEIEGAESLLDLKSKFGIEIEPTEAYTTVNGFLMHYASHQHLTAKTVIIWKNYVFSVLSVKDGAVEKVRITEIPDDDKKE